MGERYKADKMGDKVESYLTLTSTLKRGEEELF